MADEVRDWLIGSDGVPVVLNGDLQLVRGRAGIAQNIRTALELAKGEWFLDLDEGLPLFEEILVKNPRMERVRAAIRKSILSVRGVATVEITPDFRRLERELVVAFEAETAEGRIVDVVTLERNP